MKAIIPFALLLALAGCSRAPEAEESAKAAAGKPGSAPSGAAQVTLTPAMQREAGLSLVEVEERRLPVTVEASARITVNENRTWRVGAVTDGRIVRVYANPGDRVKSGQVLARMHSHDIHESRAMYRKALADAGNARAQQEYAEKMRNRARRLYSLKAASLEQVEQAESALRTAQTETANADLEVQRTGRHLVEFLRIPLEEPAGHREGEREPDQDLVPIFSPGSGIVLVRNVTPGTAITPSGDLFIIADLASVWAIAAVNEEHLGKISVGRPAEVHIQAFPGRMFSGRITKLGESLDPQTRTLQVRIELPNPGGVLKPEMYATVAIHAGASQAGLFIPEGALQEVSGHPSVFVEKSQGAFEVRPVRAGRTLQGEIEILQGLSAGERVVDKGSFVLKSQLLKSAGEE